MPSSNTPRPRGPGLAFAAVTVLLLVLLATFALTSRQPPPPTIAEFAPQAVENITDAPTDQSSSSGKGAGECRSGSADTCSGVTETAPSVASPAPITVARVRKCIGDPPRQIEDPQSPPCVPFWEGDNGGATHKGVTRDEIKIAVADDPALPERLVENLTTFFNRRFEFYGRQLVTKIYTPSEGDPAGQAADAIQVNEQVGAFAAIDYGIDIAGGDRSIYYDRLASFGISSFNWTPNYTKDGDVAKRIPHQWQHFADLPMQQRHLAALICRALTGRQAQYGGADVAIKTRKFGIISEQSGDGGTTFPDTSILENALKQCNAPIGPVLQAPSFDSVAARNAIVQMQTEDVTSIIYIGDGGNVGTLYMSGANSQGYTPEWLFTDFVNMNNDYFVQSLWPSGQAIHSFGVTFNNKFNEESEMPWAWATKEVDPGYGGAYDWSHRYYVLYLQMASAIQMAGPKLAPEAMVLAMRKTKFPNPGAAQAPYYQANIDYSGGDPWMQQDATLVWWGASTRSHSTGLVGTWCYANVGRRYAQKAWPATETGLFQEPCR